MELAAALALDGVCLALFALSSDEAHAMSQRGFRVAWR